MAVTEETGGATVMDETYEFSAPRFFDFIKGETDEESLKAELWFDTALSYAPSPFMPKIKTARSITVDSLCDFREADKMQKMLASVDVPERNIYPQSMDAKTEEVEVDKMQKAPANVDENVLETNIKPQCLAVTTVKEDDAPCTEKERIENDYKGDSGCFVSSAEGASAEVAKDACTPKPALLKKVTTSTNSKKTQNKKILTNTKSQLKSATGKSIAGTLHLSQENQAIKRQKLEGGKTRQILNVKHQILPHNKSKLGFTMSSSTSKTNKEERKVYVRETPTTPASVPFVSMAEMMKRFQSSTRDLALPNIASNTKPKLTLTRPKEPEFETSQRIRPTRVKSSAELEEELMAKIPKFKARPLNKKILQTATLPPIPRSTPQPPEFKEFRLETLARAHHNADTASIASTEVSHKGNSWKPHHLTEPKPPLLQTSLRARPPKVKSSLELEQEELQNIPKFRAKPLNKKIFESKGDIGIFCNTKKHVTEPQEFHFATDERIPPPASYVADLFGKLSLKSEPERNNHNPIKRNTTPNPFHLHTEERGAEKEKKLIMELLHKELEEEIARIPKANPYPYTTDYPVIPPKPEPKQCTRPEPFQLESLMRHEEEMQKEQEERQRIEREEAQMREFKALPILKEDPIPLPEKVRKPLTQVQEFSLHMNHRAVDRAQFDERIKEKEMVYKRYREESEAARMIEEEKALKQLRRTMVPHARPVPKFDHPFCPQKSSKDITKPKSPTLRILQRKERRKVFNGTVLSSPASNMR
ncbi:hypothetical protein LR48_Vigan08g104700 [Vigna angularis]|uniref:Protein TPX2-like protein n=2 Tax=Phaseolus angularis TaxID=3914 RepID=A0A0L9V552_PHAAN|nr:protein TPX2 [Vigna angularis]KAG2397168.1 Protein TPX2-like protein [Vigna angularis]KOM50220.1 hypothetical protein LR48_Vigan08g104700 [Vigna angularis]BAT90100.1 hypothetical protein VIGAN_06127700 [Vigna angularis var. angularis]